VVPDATTLSVAVSPGATLASAGWVTIPGAESGAPAGAKATPRSTVWAPADTTVAADAAIGASKAAVSW
jgi:hypothetical protein